MSGSASPSPPHDAQSLRIFPYNGGLACADNLGLVGYTRPVEQRGADLKLITLTAAQLKDAVVRRERAAQHAAVGGAHEIDSAARGCTVDEG